MKRFLQLLFWTFPTFVVPFFLFLLGIFFCPISKLLYSVPLLSSTLSLSSSNLYLTLSSRAQANGLTGTPLRKLITCFGATMTLLAASASSRAHQMTPTTTTISSGATYSFYIKKEKCFLE
jgi:hypothetical protein